MPHCILKCKRLKRKKKKKNKNSQTSANKIKFRLDNKFSTQLHTTQQHRMHSCALHTAQDA